LNIIACLYLISLSQPQRGHIPPVSVPGLALTQSDLPGFVRTRESGPTVVVGTDRREEVLYSLFYLGPKSNDGREGLTLDLHVFNDAKAAKQALESRRQVYQAPSHHGSLTGMAYASEVDSEVAKNAMGVIALKDRFLLELGLSFPDTNERRQSMLLSQFKSRKLLVDQIAAKTLQRAANQNWPKLGKHK